MSRRNSKPQNQNKTASKNNIADIESKFSHDVHNPSVIHAQPGTARNKRGRRNTLQRVIPLLELCNTPERINSWKKHRAEAGSFQIIAVHCKTAKCTFNYHTLVHLLAYDGNSTVIDCPVKPRPEDGCLLELDNCKGSTFSEIEKSNDFDVAKKSFQQIMGTIKYAIIWAGVNILQDVKTLGGAVPGTCCFLDLSRVFQYYSRPYISPTLKDLCEQLLNVKMNSCYEEIIYALAKRSINHGDICILQAPVHVKQTWRNEKLPAAIYEIKVSNLSDHYKRELESIFKDYAALKNATQLEPGVMKVTLETQLPFETLLYSTMGYSFPDERSVSIEYMSHQVL